jgi:hypothetical protein
VAVNLRAELHRLARGVRTVGARVQHGAAVAKAGDPPAIEQVGVDARDLRGGVGADAEHAAGQLVDQLEGLQPQRLARPGEQRLQVFQQRRHHQLVTVATRRVQQFAAQFFDVPGLGRQHIGDVIRQDPGGHGERGGC